VFVDRKPVPFFAKGPDPTRLYTQDTKRWSIVEGDCKKDGFKVQVLLNSGWGRRETIGSLIVPFVGFLLFGSMCLAILYHDPNNEFVGQFFQIIVGICLLQVLLFGAMIWFEVSYFNRLPSQVLTIYDNREFSIDGEKHRHTLPPGSVLRYTLHHSSGAQGESSKSELDLVVRDGSEIIRVHKLFAFQDNWCWRPAQKLSKLADLPL